MKTLAAIVVAGAALALWGHQLWPRRAPNQQSLRDTAGIEATALAVVPAGNGYRVQCRLVNRRQRLAEQVVFQVGLIETDGRTLAVNPLASASALAPGETRETAVFVPATATRASPTAVVEVSLVRWEQ